MKIKPVYAAIAIAVIAGLAAAVWWWASSYVSNSYVASVAGEKISKAEYSYFLYIIKEQMESSTKDPKAFWKSKIDGRSAQDKAKDVALDQAKTYKILMIQVKNSKISLTGEEKDKLNADFQSSVEQNGGRNEYNKSLIEQYKITMDQYKSINENFALITKYIDKYRADAKITDQDIKKYYDEKKSDFDKVTVRHILFSTQDPNTGVALPEDKLKEKKKKADDMLARVKAGEDMKALAGQYSEDPSVKDNKGEFTYDKYDNSLAQNFKDWGLTAKVGDSDIIETYYGYHVMKLEKKEPTPFEKTDKNLIKNIISNKRFQDQLAAWKKDSRYNVEKNKKVYDQIKMKI